MKILLAPMEGVVDFHMRELLTAIGDIDYCVTEFIRVTDHLLPDRVFYKRCPELYNNSLTSSGTPVRVQLLGCRAEVVAANAVRVAELGASAVDLNFGCPAKTVNKSNGGAYLLKTPNRLYDIISETRRQVPLQTPVTAKIRLGYEDRSAYLDNALAAYEGGADELTVHARSKVDGYKPPAYWEYITTIREAISIPVIANGEIWSIEDFKRCQAVTGCDRVMIGRGLLSFPDLAKQIKATLNKTALKNDAQNSRVQNNCAHNSSYTPLAWSDICVYLKAFFETTVGYYPEKYMGNRLKQWLHYLCRQYPQAMILFEKIKRCRERDVISQAIDKSAVSF